MDPLTQALAGIRDAAFERPLYSPFRAGARRWQLSRATALQAEADDRALWIADVKERLGLLSGADIAEAAATGAVPGRLAFCASGNEMPTAIALRLGGVEVDQVIAHPWLSGDQVYLVPGAAV